jgi:hypothetical protein
LISLRRYLRQLNIDKDILSMKNFNVYDPMKRGQGLVLDGQTLAHIEVGGQCHNLECDLCFADRFFSTTRELKTVHCSNC